MRSRMSSGLLGSTDAICSDAGASPVTSGTLSPPMESLAGIATRCAAGSNLKRRSYHRFSPDSEERTGILGPFNEVSEAPQCLIQQCGAIRIVEPPALSGRVRQRKQDGLRRRRSLQTLAGHSVSGADHIVEIPARKKA